MHTTINQFYIELDEVSELVTIDHIHKAHLNEMTIFEQYVDHDNLELFKLIFEKNFTIAVHVDEKFYRHEKSIVIYVENDAFSIFELCFHI